MGLFVTAAKADYSKKQLKEKKKKEKNPKHSFERLNNTEVYKVKHKVPFHQLPAPSGVIIGNILVHVLSEKEIFEMVVF